MSEGLEQGRFPRARGAIIFGVVRFTVVSLLAYGIWAFGPKMGVPVLYSLIVVAYVVLSGLLMNGLIEGPRPLARWHLIFVPGFLLYAVFWCVGWFGLGGHVGEVFGSAAGLFFLSRTIVRGFGGGRSYSKCSQRSFFFILSGIISETCFTTEGRVMDCSRR